MTVEHTDSPDAAASDENLMRLAGDGEREAFVTLVRRHQQGLVNFFRRMGDYNDAEDLAQDTFLRLFRCSRKYRPTAKFTTFLYTLARRTRIDRWRRLERRKKALETMAAEREADAAPGKWAADPGEKVNAALATLSEEMRAVVVMKIYQGLKYREIAGLLGIPLGTVKTRMFHSLKRLREAMENEKRA